MERSLRSRLFLRRRLERPALRGLIRERGGDLEGFAGVFFFSFLFIYLRYYFPSLDRIAPERLESSCTIHVGIVAG